MNTLVWLITYTVDGERRQVVHTHNAVADYRQFGAAAQPFDVAAVDELIASAKRLLPKNVALNNPNVPSNQAVEHLATIGELRALAAALARCEARS